MKSKIAIPNNPSSWLFNKAERNQMNRQKSKSTFRAILLTLILMVAVLGVSSAVAAEKKMLKDPSTGKMVEAPQYGGTIVFPPTGNNPEPPHADAVIRGNYLMIDVIGPVLEKLGMTDWSTDRDKECFCAWSAPLETSKPHLAESYETPGPLTYIFKIRKGIHWHDKPPMNGRELTADDIAYNFHRVTGLGSGFTEPNKFVHNITGLGIESITATDRYTVVFKMKKANWMALLHIYNQSHEGAWIYPPEVIKEHGDAQDWKNLVGTGPYELTDWVKGTSMTFKKNPNYWAFDEKFPDYRLPYADELKRVQITDPAAQLAAFRAGQIAILRGLGVDDGESLRRTNPDATTYTTMYQTTKASFAMNVREPPFDDIRVRQAMNLALDHETMNKALYGGLGDATPYGIVGPSYPGEFIPFEEWPEAVKANHRYDPERAKRLLAEAGYPKGFKTTLNYTTEWYSVDLDYAQAAKDYWKQIGVDVEIKLTDGATVGANIKNATYKGMTLSGRANQIVPLFEIREFGHGGQGAMNHSLHQDLVMDTLIEAAENAPTLEKSMALTAAADMYYIKQQWTTWAPRPPTYDFGQPWLKGWNGEYHLAGGMYTTIYSRFWVDQKLKQEMGH